MRRRHLGLTVALIAPLLAGCGDQGWARAACEPARAHPSGATTVTISSGGLERSAILFVPASYDGTVEFPLVLSWHGYSSNADDHLAYADFRELADDDRFLVVVPQGTGDPTRFNLGAGIVGDTDDVRFALGLLDQAAADMCLDPRRVYSTGMSNGGGMSGLLACRAPERFAAVAMVSLLLMPEPCGQPAPAVLGMMGTADLVVPVQGGRVNCCDGWPIAPAAETMAAWARHAGCEESDDDHVQGSVERQTWTRCAADVEVRYYEVGGGGHTWPGGPDTDLLGPTNRDIDASEEIWRFFRRFALPAR